MPSLKQLREKVYRAMDFNPQLEAYRDAIGGELNDAYLLLSCQYPWLFLKKSGSILLRKTANNTTTSGTIEIPASNLRLVTFTTATPSSEWEGQTFVGPDSTEYKIGAVSGQSVYLSSAYTAAVTAGDTGWSVKFTNYILPRDLADSRAFYSITDDKGLLEFIDNDNEEFFYFDPDQTGDSRFIVEGEPVYLLPPETAPTVSGTSGGGSLDASQEYEYCYTYLYEGIESPPSPIVSQSTTGANQTINLVSFPDTQWSSNSKATGKKKRIYRRRVDGGGRWVKVDDITDSTTTLGDDGSKGVDVDSRGEANLLMEEAPRQAVRAWQIPDDTLRTISLRYQRRPRKLIADSDAPEWPVPYHYLIVWWALKEICLQHGMTKQSQIYGGMAEKLLDRMKDRHLTRSIRKRVRRSWAGHTVSQTVWGNPTKS